MFFLLWLLGKKITVSLSQHGPNSDGTMCFISTLERSSEGTGDCQKRMAILRAESPLHVHHPIQHACHLNHLN